MPRRDGASGPFKLSRKRRKKNMLMGSKKRRRRAQIRGENRPPEE